MKLQLDKWQKEVKAYEGSFLLCTGRQVGKTTIMAIKAVEYMLKHPNSQIIVVSLTEDQAKLIIAMMQNYIDQEYRYCKKKLKKADKWTQTRVSINNGSSTLARPVGNTGDAVRGFTGDILIIDEASRMPELAFDAAKPVLLTTGGEIWMCSTPHGKEGYFWDSYNNAILGKSKRFKVWHISSEEVILNRPISASWTEEKRRERIKFLEDEKMDMSEVRYGQEYLGMFLDELRRYFTEEWIEKVCILEKKEISPGKSYYLGVDIARLGGDESSFEIIERESSESLRHVYTETAVSKLTTWTEDKILQLDRIYRLKKIYIDAGAGSLGVGILDHLLRTTQTRRKVEAINNRKIVMDKDGKSKQRLLKEDLYDNLRSLGEKGHIFLLNDENVKLSLRSIQFEQIKKQKGLTQFRIFGNYSHIAEGLIRAAWCAKEKNLKLWAASTNYGNRHK